MPKITDWITAIAGVVSALAIIVLLRQARLVAKQIELQTQQTKDDHDRSRREHAINQVTRFTDRLQQGSSAARRLVETLDVEQTRKLYNEEPFTLSANEKNKNWIAACLAQTDIKLDTDYERGCQLHLSQPVVSAIRWKAITYLNGLEGVMAAWRHNVADREMITEQFGYLIDENKGHHLLTKLRTEAGGDAAYPAIAEFADDLKMQTIKTKQHIKEGKGPINKP